MEGFLGNPGPLSSHRLLPVPRMFVEPGPYLSFYPLVHRCTQPLVSRSVTGRRVFGTRLRFAPRGVWGGISPTSFKGRPRSRPCHCPGSPLFRGIRVRRFPLSLTSVRSSSRVCPTEGEYRTFLPTGETHPPPSRLSTVGRGRRSDPFPGVVVVEWDDNSLDLLGGRPFHKTFDTCRTVCIY